MKLRKSEQTNKNIQIYKWNRIPIGNIPWRKEKGKGKVSKTWREIRDFD